VSLQAVTSSIVEKNVSSNPGQMYVLGFQLDQQIYTLPIDIIYQIIDIVHLTRLPEVNDSIEGIFNYHGTTVPVVNLRRLLNLPKLPINLHTPIILVAFSEHIIGMIVDKIAGVVSVSKSSVFTPNDLLPEGLGQISILEGVVPNSEQYMLMLNLEKLFSSQKKDDLETVFNQLQASSLENQMRASSANNMGSVPDPEKKNGGGDHRDAQKKDPGQSQKSGVRKNNGNG
jgi:purine-binding chemotaxis protein CheW